MQKLTSRKQRQKRHRHSTVKRYDKVNIYTPLSAINKADNGVFVSGEAFVHMITVSEFRG